MLDKNPQLQEKTDSTMEEFVQARLNRRFQAAPLMVFVSQETPLFTPALYNSAQSLYKLAIKCKALGLSDASDDILNSAIVVGCEAKDFSQFEYRLIREAIAGGAVPDSYGEFKDTERQKKIAEKAYHLICDLSSKVHDGTDQARKAADIFESTFRSELTKLVHSQKELEVKMGSIPGVEEPMAEEKDLESILREMSLLLVEEALQDEVRNLFEHAIDHLRQEKEFIELYKDPMIRIEALQRISQSAEAIHSRMMRLQTLSLSRAQGEDYWYRLIDPNLLEKIPAFWRNSAELS